MKYPTSEAANSSNNMENSDSKAYEEGLECRFQRLNLSGEGNCGTQYPNQPPAVGGASTSCTSSGLHYKGDIRVENTNSRMEPLRNSEYMTNALPDFKSPIIGHTSMDPVYIPPYMTSYQQPVFNNCIPDDLAGYHATELGAYSLSQLDMQFPHNNHQVMRMGSYSPSRWQPETQLNGYGNHLVGNGSYTPSYLPSQNAFSALQQVQIPQPDIRLVQVACTKAGSDEVLKLLRQEDNSWCAELILDGVLGLIFDLMIDEYGYRVYKQLLHTCNRVQLKQIVAVAVQQPESFIVAAKYPKGSISIQQLIRVLRQDPDMSCITAILATNSYELLTHDRASHVIRQCFAFLKEEHNKVLYDRILPEEDFFYLAINQVGCLSLNSCIDNITGTYKGRLLDLVAKYAAYLAHDSFGNFVVQHVIELDDQQINNRIFCKLQDHYVGLAHKKCGSHVVEKCLKSSPLGLKLVVTAFLACPKRLLKLAQGEFGNYVIKTALQQTKENAYDLYLRLVETLEPFYPKSLQNGKGTYVAKEIKEAIEQRRAG